MASRCNMMKSTKTTPDVTDEKNFTGAEYECNKLPGGHLASFWTPQQREFLISMIR